MCGASRLLRLRRHWGIVALLIIAGAVYASTRDVYGMLMWDEAEYASLARALVRGTGYSVAGAPEALRPPLLPLAAATVLWSYGGANDAAIRSAAIGLALLALASLYAAVARVYDLSTGLAASALLASMPWFWTATPHLLSEILFLTLFAAALFAWSCGLTRDARWFPASWLCLGGAFLVRYTALLFGPLALLLLLVELRHDGAAVWRRVRSPACALAPLLGALVVAPWLVRQTLLFGDPLVGVRQASTQLQVYQPNISMPWWQYLVGLPVMLSWPTLGLAVAGAWWALRRDDRFALHCVVVAAGVLIWFSAYRYKEPRLISSLLPAAAVLAALGVTRGLFGRAPGAAVAVLTGAIAVSNFGATRPTFAYDRTLGYPSFLDAMAFVRQHSSAEALVVGPNPPQISWYADRKCIDFPEQPALAALLARADWVVITNFERGQKAYVPQLAQRIPAAAFDDGSAARFGDDRFATLVVRAARLREALARRAAE